VSRLGSGRWRWGIGGASLLSLMALTGPTAWIHSRVRACSYGDVALLPARSVAIVPGAAVSGGEPLASLADRLRAALRLYRAGRVDTIFISGQNTAAQPEVTVMRNWLLREGVPERQLLVDEQGTRTWNTMWNARSTFHIAEAIVCTQALYLPRALYIARSMGIDAVGAALDTPIALTAHTVGREVAKTTLAFLEAAMLQPAATPLPSGAIASR